MKFGLIGTGLMGSIVARSIQTVAKGHWYLNDHELTKAQELQKTLGGTVTSLDELVQSAEVLILAVKPQHFDGLFEEVSPLLQLGSTKLVISIAAGISIGQLKEWVGERHSVIRMMPNTPLSVGKGVISFATDTSVSEKQKEQFIHWFTTSASCFEIAESLLDAATGVAGCGPAFIYQLIEAMADAGVKNGLPRQVALQMAAQTVLGAATMVLETGIHPAALKDQVCSPGGSTIVGVSSLESNGFRGTVIEAIDQATRKSTDLSKFT